nr:tetratricopeptide repeat protein [Reyranella soli]
MIYLALFEFALPARAQLSDYWESRLVAATALRDGDYATAMKIYRPLAEQGEPTALFSVATMYHRGGRGVQKDVGEAVRWYSKAAEKGDMQALMILTNMYMVGPTDLETTRKPRDGTRWELTEATLHASPCWVSYISGGREFHRTTFSHTNG